MRAALLNSGSDCPQRRITVNLAPAHVRKAGPGFDLAIAVGVLAASGQALQEPLADYVLCGELSLTGELRPVRGALATALGARAAGYRRLLVPERTPWRPRSWTAWRASASLARIADAPRPRAAGAAGPAGTGR